MLYAKNKQPFDANLFQNPTAEYRGTPFWAWNDKLDADRLCRQIEHFQNMGLGGFHMHVRTGMATPYLGEAFMDLIETCVDKARELDMLAWLYDEDRWPSGAAGGLVTQNEAYRARHLLFTARPYAEDEQAATGDASARGGRSGQGKLLACYDILLRSDGTLKSCRRVHPSEAVSGQKWYAYLETAAPSPWFNNQTYVDTLSAEAIADFIDKTHERYRQRVGDQFGGVIPAIFTDEPQFTHKTTLLRAKRQDDLVMPWTIDFPQSFAKAYGFDLLERLPELVWELPDEKVSQARYAYHDHVAERFAVAFADQCGTWCRENGLMLTGHMMEEPTLQSQTAALGEAMRSYRGFDLPGIDMLCNHYEYTTAKQAQSAARQFGSPGVLSELYGVTNWDFDFRGHKLQGDWQAALGVTVRVHHLSWYSMAGEAKRDYPASIHYQSSWSKRYKIVEDHFARVNTAMTRGRARCRIGVVHPVESFWLCWGPQDQTAARRDKLDQEFEQLAKWLLFGQLDFDYLSESLLPAQCQAGDFPLPVGDMAYEAVILPDVLCLRKTTIDRLERFVDAGGTLLCLGDAPRIVDGVPSDAARPLYAKATRIAQNPVALHEALEPVRDLELRHQDGRRCEHLLYQMREDGKDRWLFLAAGKNPGTVDQPRPYPLQVELMGRWQPQLHDTQSGKIEDLPVVWTGSTTQLDLTLFEHDSVLLRLLPWTPEAMRIPQIEKLQDLASVSRRWGLGGDVSCDAVPIELSEPNVLLLDMAEWRLDDGDWQPREEILRIDNQIRRHLDWPTRESRMAQPWTVADEIPEHQVRLRFDWDCRCDLQESFLALEDLEKATVWLDGREIETEDAGWYVDEAIRKMKLPPVSAGKHVLEMQWPINRRSNLEWAYVLGDFAVFTQGDRAHVESPVRRVRFGDLARQGFAFYGGPLRYKLEAQTQGETLQIRVPFYRGAMVDVYLDGKRQGDVTFSPYTLEIGGVSEGQHTIELELHASRFNSFGCVHNSDRDWSWFGADSWRTQGDAWAYEYQLKEIGILKAPLIRCIDDAASRKA